MAKPKHNIVIEKTLTQSLLHIFTPNMKVDAERIAAIEGITSAIYNADYGVIYIQVNPCYDMAELKAEIRLAIEG